VVESVLTHAVEDGSMGDMCMRKKKESRPMQWKIEVWVACA